MRFLEKSFKAGVPRWNLIFGTASVAALALVIGCGGGGGGGGASAGVISGDNAQIATAVVDAKAMGAGSVPFMLLNQLSPTSFALRDAGKTRGLTLVPALNLYVSAAVSGKTATLNYYTDPNGASAAGKIVAVGNQNLGGTYSYPLTFNVSGSITKGNIPLTVTQNGTAPFLSFSDAAGANTMNGDINLTKDQIDLNLSNLILKDDLTIDPSSTSITVKFTYQGSVPTTTVITGLSGGPFSTISGAASVTASLFGPGSTPTTGTGTAVIDLPNNKFSLNVNLGGIPLNVSQAIDGSLNATTTSGLSKVIGNPWSFVLSSLATSTSTTGSTNTTGSTSGTTGTYQTPVLTKGMSGENFHTVEQAISDGEMVGETFDSFDDANPVYWSSPTAAPIPLPTPQNYLYCYARGIATYGSQIVIVGSGTSSNGVLQPLEWFANVGTTNFSVYTVTNGINGLNDPSGAEFYGISANGNAIVGCTYDSKYVQHPFFYAPHASQMAALPDDGRTTNLRAIAVDNNNNVLGTGDGQSPFPGTWSKVSIVSNSISSPFQALGEVNGVNNSIQAYRMSSTGVVAGGDGQKAIYWSAADGFIPHALSLGTNARGSAYAVSDSGTQFAGGILPSSSTSYDLGFWSSLTGNPTDISLSLKNASSYMDLAGFFILKDGSLICIDVTGTSPTITDQYLYVQKK